jgi:hypothetical protein
MLVMFKQTLRIGSLLLVLTGLLCIGTVGSAFAVKSSSANYSVNETQFGAGSDLHDCSTSYCSKISVGDTTVGRATSTTYSAQLGFNTSDVPLLEVFVTPGTQNMGVIDPTVTGTSVSVIKVRNYLSGGYIMQITGPSPSQGIHSLTTLATPTTSHQGAEQFGINLSTNTAPAIGAAPVQVPNSSYSFGSAAANYATPDLFQYIDGDIIAQSAKSSGETDYTLSMIINVSTATPGGRYDGSYSAVVVPTY